MAVSSGQKASALIAPSASEALNVVPSELEPSWCWYPDRPICSADPERDHGIKATELAVKIGYLETSAHQMRYARFRELGMFTGSDAVEGGCKNVIGAPHETIRHALEPPRCRRHKRTALARRHRPPGPDLAKYQSRSVTIAGPGHRAISADICSVG